jgi:hypothetical protein
MQVENIYIVEYDGRTIGVWNSFDSAFTFIMGCQQNGLMISSANIKTYKINTCFCFETKTVNSTNYIKPHKQTKIPINNTIINSDEHSKESLEPFTAPTKVEDKPKINFTDPIYVEITKQKVELQHKINMLKQQKKKIEESKTTYENDYKLFELFTESKQKDPNFVIPEIFIKKFDLMTQLNKENKLSWDNFVKEFQHDNLYNEYFGLNSYEEMFLESDDENKSSISEELDIESESSTEISVSDNEEN